MCRKCTTVKSIDDFQLYVRQNELDICKACNTMKKVGAHDEVNYLNVERIFANCKKVRFHPLNIVSNGVTSFQFVTTPYALYGTQSVKLPILMSVVVNVCHDLFPFSINSFLNPT